MFELSDLMLILPELCIAVMALFLLVYGAFAGNRATAFITLMAAIAIVGATYLLVNQSGEPVIAMNGMLRSDMFTQFCKLILLVGALLALTLSADWLKKEEYHKFEYPILLLLALLGLMLLVSSNDLLALYMSLELASLSLYVMTAFDRGNAKASEAALKYFVLGSLASGMMLFGASLIYGFTGSTNFAVLSGHFTVMAGQPVLPGVVVGLVMVMVGFCFKVSAVPFHMWTPDVYEGAPTPVVTFFAVVPKIAALSIFARFLFYPFEDLNDQWQQVVIFISIASMVVGALGALMQTNIKRLLAYSSIGHVGYALVGLATGVEGGAQAMLIYLALYLFMSVGAFGFVLLMQRDGKAIEDISSLSGLSKTSPRMAAFMAIMMFSMAGIPPLAGFFGKMYVFLSALEEQLYTLVIIGLLSSVIAAYYYLKVVKIMYFDEAGEPFDVVNSLSVRVVLAICALVTAVFFIIPTPLIEIAGYAAQALSM